MCIIGLRLIFLLTATIGVLQNNPMFTPGVANKESLVLYARSQLATNWQPAAKAAPWTFAITGFFPSTICNITWEQRLNNFWYLSFFLRLLTSFRLWPALNPFPAPSIIITFTFLSASNFFNDFNKSERFLNERELYVFGSSIIIDEIWELILFILILLVI